MKRSLITAGLVVLWSVFAWAQQQPDQPTRLKVHVGTLQGCLEGSPDNYQLTQDRTGARFRLVGNSGQLKSHLGQEVLVTGELPENGQPAPSAVGENQDATTETGSATSSTTANIIQVSKIQTVSKACSVAEQPAAR